MERAKMKQRKIDISTDNIFADLGLEDAEEMIVRSDLLSEVINIIRKSNLTQKEIANILGISAPKVSALINGKISHFSNNTLMQYLAQLGCNVEIQVIPRRSSLSVSTKRGSVSVRRRFARRRKISKK